jgi:uncharacterized protein (TIGR00255 family)
MKSMTGYGEGTYHARGTNIAVQVRSLNHRHLDLQLRAPREYLMFEEEIRKLLRGKISRGRIDLFINRSASSGQSRKLELDVELLGQYLSTVKEAKKKFRLAGDIEVSLLSQVPNLFRIREVEVQPAHERQGLFIALQTALKKLEQSREREGRQLKADMQLQIKQLKKITAALSQGAAENPMRLQKPPIPGTNGEYVEREEKEATNPGGLKGDINEEVVRLKSHVSALALVVRQQEPVGKKIDFMLQEMQRELNTISSKIPHLPIVQLVLAGKERVEKIREQTQNVE